LAFSGVYGVISQKIACFISTAIRISTSARSFKINTSELKTVSEIYYIFNASAFVFFVI
jgi:hypothetical protein